MKYKILHTEIVCRKVKLFPITCSFRREPMKMTAEHSGRLKAITIGKCRRTPSIGYDQVSRINK